MYQIQGSCAGSEWCEFGVPFASKAEAEARQAELEAQFAGVAPAQTFRVVPAYYAQALAAGLKPSAVQQVLNDPQWEDGVREHGDETLCFWDFLLQVSPAASTWKLCCRQVIAHLEGDPARGGARREAKLANARELLAELVSWE